MMFFKLKAKVKKLKIETVAIEISMYFLAN